MNDFPAEYFQKQDASDDALFYKYPRKVVHIDEGAITKLSEHFANLLPAGGTYLDLMSSWRSHLPPVLKPERVVGLGMNASEMQDNPQLGQYLIQNLNTQQELPFDNATFDGAVCTVSVQYLQKPVAVFGEVGRVLKPGAPFIVTFSNRCFPSKAVAVWLGSTDAQHMAIVTRYFEDAGNWRDVKADAYTPMRGDPLYAVWAHRT